MSAPLDQVKVILFDAGDTLFRVKGGVGAVYAAVAARFGVNADPDLLHRRFIAAWPRKPPLVFPGVLPEDLPAFEQNWWKGLVQEVFEETPLPDFDPFFHTLYAEFEGEGAWELFPETVGVLQHLKAAGYRLGIVSNFDSRLFKICERLGIRHYFETIVVSTGAGAAKPSPLIFQRALASLDILPLNSLYVGDSPKHDLAGANCAGLWSVLLDRSEKYPNEGGTRIKSLAELAGLLR